MYLTHNLAPNTTLYHSANVVFSSVYLDCLCTLTFIDVQQLTIHLVYGSLRTISSLSEVVLC